MNSRVLVTLLWKDIRQLDAMTEGFLILNEFPDEILNGVREKLNDINGHLDNLALWSAGILPDMDETSDEEVNDERSSNDEDGTVEQEMQLTSTYTDEQTSTNNISDSDGFQEPVDSDWSEDTNTDANTLVEHTDIESINSNEEFNGEVFDFELLPIGDINESEDVRGTEFDDSDLSNFTDEEPEPSVLEAFVSKQTLDLVEEDTPQDATEFSNNEYPQITEENEINSVQIELPFFEDTNKSNETVFTPRPSLFTSEASVPFGMDNKRITDIKKAISIGERFRFQRELFGGNGEDMNKTLTFINQCVTLAEALDFLEKRYNWERENESVVDFHRIVKRRFI